MGKVIREESRRSDSYHEYIREVYIPSYNL